jgi:cobyrinic acid a,c-diamide synthase
MRNIDILKQLLKDKAGYIKTQRLQASSLKNSGHGPQAHEIHMSTLPYSLEYRIHHIAYCELRGRRREQIEVPHEINALNSYQESLIEQIKTQYAWTQEEINEYNERKEKREALCASSN